MYKDGEVTVPVSKKRKKKQSSGPPPAKNKVVATPKKKKKLSRQEIIIYVVSGLMILSLAIGLIATGSTRRTQVQPTVTPVTQQNNQTLETPNPASTPGSQPESSSSPAGDATTPPTPAQ